MLQSRAAAAVFAPRTALANDALEDAFSARTKVLRPLQSGTCDAPTPEWLRGDWTVAASRFEGVSFPQSGSYFPRGGFTQTIAGARRGTILAIPNAGAAPKGYARSYAHAGHVFGRDERGVDAESLLVRRHGHRRRAERETNGHSLHGAHGQARRAPAADRGGPPGLRRPSPDSLIVAERWAQASVVDDADAALTV